MLGRDGEPAARRIARRPACREGFRGSATRWSCAAIRSASSAAATRSSARSSRSGWPARASPRCRARGARRRSSAPRGSAERARGLPVHGADLRPRRGLRRDSGGDGRAARLSLPGAARRAAADLRARHAARRPKRTSTAGATRGRSTCSPRMNELTMFIASRCLIGEEFRRRLSREFAHLYHDLEGGMNLLAFFKPHLPLPAFRRRDRARARMAELISAVIAERRGGAARGRGLPADADGRALRRRPRAHRRGDHRAPARPSSSPASTPARCMGAWTGILLLQHPGTCRRCCAEQEDRARRAAAITLDSAAASRRARTLHQGSRAACTRRWIMLMRRIVRDFEYGGFVVPAGDLAMVSPAVAIACPTSSATPTATTPTASGPSARRTAG